MIIEEKIKNLKKHAINYNLDLETEDKIKMLRYLFLTIAFIIIILTLLNVLFVVLSSIFIVELNNIVMIDISMVELTKSEFKEIFTFIFVTIGLILAITGFNYSIIKKLIKYDLLKIIKKLSFKNKYYMEIINLIKESNDEELLKIVKNLKSKKNLSKIDRKIKEAALIEMNSRIDFSKKRYDSEVKNLMKLVND